MSEDITSEQPDTELSVNPTKTSISPLTTKQTLSVVKDEAKLGLVKRVAQDWAEIVEGQVDLAKGIFEEKMITDPDDKTQKILKVFKRAPSSEAGQYLINQVVGKPIETVEERKTVNLIFD